MAMAPVAAPLPHCGLRFNEHPVNFNEGGNVLSELRGRGWSVLRDVFARETVDAFREQLLARVEPLVGAAGRLVLPDDAAEMIAPLRAPRLRQMLPQALCSPRSVRLPRVSLVEASWLVSESGYAAPRAWHKDQLHDGIRGPSYEHPLDIHIGIYLRDVETAEDGPTEIISGSHWADQADRFNPHVPGAAVPSELMLCRKQDVVIWDQRCYHRGTTRSSPGHRIVGICGFFPIVLYDQSKNFAMPRAVASAWQAASEAEDAEDESFWGGQWSLVSVQRCLAGAAKL